MSDLLDTINSPADLRRLGVGRLAKLAQEIRQRIIEVVSETGGHLASNLGIVELTLALHYVFNTPEDQIVWDVGHQTYTHKLVTGRRERFDTLRQWEGISGFPKREESPYDDFNTGHASTSISAALGIAEGVRHNREQHHTIAVIGDGSLTGGLAFEGLNNAGTLKGNLIVVLNDNEMSISRNVGGLARHLDRIISGQPYHRFKKDFEHFVKSIPNVGGQMYETAGRIKDAFRALVLPATMFNELGFEYHGPINGHDIREMVETFQAVRKLQGPILVHVTTKKGKGYAPAEAQPHTFHSAPAFVIATGESKEKSPIPSYTSVFANTMVRLAAAYPKIIAITAAMTDGTGLAKFAKQFPDRFYDVGIAEEHAVTFAAGLSTQGLRPVVAIYSTFLQRAYDQLFHDVCIQKLPVTFALDRAGIVGSDGPTHNGLYDLSYLRHLPGMVVMAPKDENELQHMMYTAINTDAPAAVRYPRGQGFGVELDTEFKLLKPGKAELLREGKQVAILAVGTMVHAALNAANMLVKSGIQAAVVNTRFVKPLDRTLICQLARETGCLVTVEENALQGGFGSAVLELLEEEGLFGVRTCRIGIPDEILEHGPQDLLRRKYSLDAEGITRTVERLLNVRLLKAN